MLYVHNEGKKLIALPVFWMMPNVFEKMQNCICVFCITNYGTKIGTWGRRQFSTEKYENRMVGRKGTLHKTPKWDGETV